MRHSQTGFTITELLVGAFVGLIVISGGLGLVVTLIGSNSDSIQASRLKLDLNAIMAIAASEIRRAGYNGDLAVPFNTATNPSLETDTANCLRYVYASDTDGDGQEDETVHYGFRYDAAEDELFMRTANSAFTCDGTITASNWVSMNDKSEVLITNVGLTDNTQCLDADKAVVDCADASAVIRVRKLDLSVTGQLTEDTTVTATVQETIRVRNDEPTS